MWIFAISKFDMTFMHYPFVVVDGYGYAVVDMVVVLFKRSHMI